MVAIFWDTVDIMVDMVTDMEDGLTTDMDTMDKPRSSSNTISNEKPCILSEPLSSFHFKDGKKKVALKVYMAFHWRLCWMK